ncbi:MAG TPA: D-alanyl-D-alanine carboxypeptidase family protein [Chloroflexota bacterium]|nr:D-alanyl-D-alanine carboxypeptidase family protein [Chloroflexota bacterium]
MAGEPDAWTRSAWGVGGRPPAGATGRAPRRERPPERLAGRGAPRAREARPVAVPSPPPPRRRPARSRRVETAIVVLGLLFVLVGLRPFWLRGQAPPPPLEVQAGASTDASSAGTAPLAPPATLPTPLPAARAGISYSFARFEADPALVAGAVSAGVPSLSGDSAIVVDVNSREVVYAKQPRKRQLMASTVKIMTAIVVLERSSLDTVITVPAEATQVEPNHMGIRAGEKLTVQELLYGLLLDSGNDAGEALAYGVGATAGAGGAGGAAGRAQFVAWMNETAAALGLKDTRFANPSGLDDPEQYSTAYDLAVLGTYALTKPDLRRIASLRDVVIESSREPGREHGWFRPGNLNNLLATYRGAIGLKPGYTEDAGYTLVAAAERDGRTLVCVTLQSRRHFTDCTALLDFGFARATPPAQAAQAAQGTPEGL